MRAYLIVAAALCIACGGATGQTYRWVDEKGGVHYTQTPPPPQAKGVQKKNFRSAGGESSDLPYAMQVAAKNFPVKLYSQPDCGAPCDGARAALIKRGVPFKEISVTSQNEIDEVKQLSGKESLPLLVVGSLFQIGFQEQRLNNLLDTAGYPAAGSVTPVESPRKPEPSAPPAAQAPERPMGEPYSYSK